MKTKRAHFVFVVFNLKIMLKITWSKWFQVEGLWFGLVAASDASELNKQIEKTISPNKKKDEQHYNSSKSTYTGEVVVLCGIKT